MAQNQNIKVLVLKRVANGKDLMVASGQGPAKWFIGNSVVHVRFRSGPKSDGVSYAYNINPNTLTANYELWICGDQNVYYLIPMSTLKSIYEDPNAYVDYQHPKLRVAEINTLNHRALYGRGGKCLDFTAYFRAKL